MVVIRAIEKGDNTLLAELIRNVFHEFGMPKTGTVYSDPKTDKLFELFQTPGSCYWVAEKMGIVLGGCGIYPTERLPEGCVELVKFYLLPDFRGKGIGRELLEKCIVSAKEMGYKQIYLESFPELGRALYMYQKAGFRQIEGPLGYSGHFACTLWMLRDL
jgi:putative acetyltransferase